MREPNPHHGRIMNEKERPMRTLKISLIASVIATVASFWVAELGVTHRIWPEHPQMAGFLFTLVTAIVVQIAWSRLVPGPQRDKN